ncbi:hypothetical protein [Cytobacillus sp. FSL R5-0596]|uniref:hypothetical protein n=1 Tax=Cytobacillus sp. FSL R5-0596 TaxID=2954696 RepID=UPI0030FA421A
MRQFNEFVGLKVKSINVRTYSLMDNSIFHVNTNAFAFKEWVTMIISFIVFLLSIGLHAGNIKDILIEKR